MRKTNSATQNFVPIEEINDGIIKLKDGGLRAILSVFAINMALKSTEEQEATILEFQNLLNTLEFSIQIVVQSRKHDIRPYISELEERLKAQKEELLQIQTSEYINFIREFSETVNIMSKHFYIVISYTPTVGAASGTSVMDTLKGLFPSKSKPAEDARFEESRNQLEQRVTVMRDSLSRLGLRSEQLDTEGAIEVFYKLFNPGEEQRANIEK